ncbi:hypothetical protein O181_043396 [Austropuccinia psidii MF-1]|uniref:Uncharacterized protein n=1 Tax=Austropuccinia psidii MF-1 TaxID=1389203 RepID=A0A9Q3HFY3_9BASI|nr:hypothetical protein [Austropuccinia psidii MF-1]
MLEDIQNFVDAFWALLQTGSGLMELTNKTLQEEVEDQCPCFERMCAILGDKQNITGFNSFDSSLQRKKDNSNSNSSIYESFSDSGNSSSEEGRSVKALVTINSGENQFHSGNSDSYRLTSASGGTKNPSSPRFKEIHTSDSSITSTPIKCMRTKGEHRGDAGPQRKLPDTLSTRKSQSFAAVLEKTSDSQDNQLENQMKSNIRYLHKHDAVQGKLKVLEMRENKEIKKLEIE